jgi:translation initiation factor 1A
MGKFNKRRTEDKSRAVPFRDGEQVYAKVTKMLGNGRLMAVDTEKTERLCIIRGNMRKREWISVGDVVLLSRRDFQDGKADVVFRYTASEVCTLSKYGELTKSFLRDDTVEELGGDIEFEDTDDIEVI